jgi:hypothetical protein
MQVYASIELSIIPPIFKLTPPLTSIKNQYMLPVYKEIYFCGRIEVNIKTIFFYLLNYVPFLVWFEKFYTLMQRLSKFKLWEFKSFSARMTQQQQHTKNVIIKGIKAGKLNLIVLFF